MKGSCLTLIGLFFILYILPLGVLPVRIPDEARYAEIPREMLASGDWVVPHLNGFRYFEKPPLGYWLNAASMMLFGESAFAARLPSALSTGISGLLVFLLARRFGGGYWTGIVSAVVLLSCAEVYGIGTFSVLDPLFAMFVTGAMVFFFFSHMEVRPHRKTAFLGLFGVFCGLAFLTKGFVAFAVPIVAIVPFMIREGRLKELMKLCWVPICAAVLVVLPWAVMIHLREPDFWQHFVWTKHIRRFISSNAQHSKAFWYFVPVLLLGALPWTFLFPAAVSGLHRKDLEEPLFRFTLCCLLFPFLFFSASQGKLGTYILPCFPPLAVLMAMGLLGYMEIGGKKAFSVGASCLAVLLAVCVSLLVLGETTVFPGIHPYSLTETWKWILVAMGMLTWSVLSALAWISPGPRKKLVLFCTAPLLVMFCAHFIMPDDAIEKRAPGDFLMRNAGRVRADTVIATKDTVQAVCWFYKRNDVLLLEKSGELAYGSSYDDSKSRVIGLDRLNDLIRDSGKDHVVLITEAEEYQDYRQHLPDPGFEDSNGQFVFACY